MGDAPYETHRLINTSTGAYLSAGGVWTNNSDRNRKTAFRNIDGSSILDRLKNLEISEWQYKDESSDIRHIGPTAQDFYGQFRVGYNETSITTLDISGVALAAIKELDRKTEKIKSLEERVAKLEQLVLRLGLTSDDNQDSPQ